MLSSSKSCITYLCLIFLILQNAIATSLSCSLRTIVCDAVVVDAIGLPSLVGGGSKSLHSLQWLVCCCYCLRGGAETTSLIARHMSSAQNSGGLFNMAQTFVKLYSYREMIGKGGTHSDSWKSLKMFHGLSTDDKDVEISPRSVYLYECCLACCNMEIFRGKRRITSSEVTSRGHDLLN